MHRAKDPLTQGPETVKSVGKNTQPLILPGAVQCSSCAAWAELDETWQSAADGEKT